MPPPETVGQALAAARGLGLARLDAQRLLAHHLARPRTWLIAHDDAPLEPARAAAFAVDAARRAAGVPLAYLTGRREFRQIELHVTPAVLDPRADTETLVDWALASIDAVARPEVLDLGCGSGAIALSIRQARPDARVQAIDISDAALDVARANAARLGLDVAFRHGDWWAGWHGGALDLAVANPPYIADDDPHLAGLRHEPRLALVSGADGLDALRAIVAGAPPHLRPGGWLWLEHGHTQAAAVRTSLGRAGFVEITTRDDLAGLERVSGGRRPPAD